MYSEHFLCTQNICLCTQNIFLCSKNIFGCRKKNISDMSSEHLLNVLFCCGGRCFLSTSRVPSRSVGEHVVIRTGALDGRLGRGVGGGDCLVRFQLWHWLPAMVTKTWLISHGCQSAMLQPKQQKNIFRKSTQNIFLCSEKGGLFWKVVGWRYRRGDAIHLWPTKSQTNDSDPSTVQSNVAEKYRSAVTKVR